MATENEKKKVSRWYGVLLVIGAVAAVAELVRGAVDGVSEARNDRAPSGHSDGSGVTRAQFDELKNGMTYGEVRTILGRDCPVAAETGEPGSTAHTLMYKCDGKGRPGANMNFMIQGERLTMKAQAGLE